MNYISVDFFKKLWTMYCEQVNRGHDPEALVAIMDFWARITPGILHLLSHSKVVRRKKERKQLRLSLFRLE